MNDKNNDLFVAIAHSEDPETQFAMEEIIEKLKSKLNELVPKACIVFAGLDMEHQLILDSINAEWQNIKLIGCTSEGEISSDLLFAEGSIAVLMFDSDTIDFSVGLGRNNILDMEGACRNAVSEALQQTDKAPCLCIATPDFLFLSRDKIIKLLKNELGIGVPIFGGAATDKFQMKTTYQFFGSEVLTNSLPILLFSGPLTYSYGVKSGNHPIGRNGRVTSSTNGILHEIDNKPAIDFYRSVMGSNALPGIGSPLAILGNDNCVLYHRGAMGIKDEGTGDITIHSDIAEGSEIQITVTERDNLIEGSIESTKYAIDNFPKDKEIKLALFFSCAGRKYLLGSRTREEIIHAKTMFHSDVQICGAYGYGGIAPLENDLENVSLSDGSFITLLLG
ncbi:MAG: hypothetical protein HW421_2532 [Ignavibacteria bacterium]|nr:hypothetical protein [Ignavibacteria bacterium]